MIIKIIVRTQQLILLDSQALIRRYQISTAKNGLGEYKNSEMTPRGWHKVRAKIGQGCPNNAVFVSRRFTGEIFSEQLKEIYPERDWILTRIFWLSGLEKGINRLGTVDSMARYIYIHGCPDSEPMGIPLSRGCIRMRNIDIIELFEQVPVGTPILITEK